MEKLNNLLSLFLIFTMLLPSIPAFAVIDVDSDEEESSPVNPPNTPPGVQCTQLDQKPATGGVCCMGLELNAVGKCDEPVYNDPALVSCSTDSTCSDGTGCYPQYSSDLFSKTSPNKEDPDSLTEARNSLRSQLTEVEVTKEDGGSCTHARDCHSYSCVSGLCKEKLVCRFANIGEVAASDVKCADGLIKTPGGKCDQSPESKNPVYLGLLDEAVITTDVNKCEFNVDQETKNSSLIAMRSLRAMEWFLATAALKDSEDCFQIMPLLKQEIGGTFATVRKNILQNFSEEMKIIEEDYQKLIDAPKKDPKEIVTIHKTEKISYGNLASRQTSGFDSLMMLYRRNLLFESYETAMNLTVENAYKKVSGLSKNMANWTSGATEWNLGSRNVTAFNCEGSKYKVKKFLKWKTKYYSQIKDRWANYYDVTGDAQLNADIVKRPEVAKALGTMVGKTPEEAVADFNKKFYMIDPLMFSTLKNGAYGQNKPLKKKSSFLGLFGGFKDLRKAYYLKGDAQGSFTKMHSDLRIGLFDFYKSMKKAPAPGEKKFEGFIYEPELLTTVAKDCLDGKEQSPACAGFLPFLEDVLDESFAHFLAYSHHTQDSYEGYFENAASYRRRLLAKLEVDMQNISKYYKEVIEKRGQQNTCIQKIMTGLKDADILAKTEDLPNGIIEGSSTDPKGTTKVTNPLSPLGNGSITTKLNSPDLSKILRQTFSFDLTQEAGKNANTRSLKDDLLTGSGGGKANFDSSSAAMMAMRANSMKSSNAKAKAAGVKFDDKEKAVRDIRRSMSGKSSGLAGNSSGGSSNFGKGSLSNANAFGKAEIGQGQETNKGEVSEATSANAEVIGIGGKGSLNLSGIDSGNKSAASGGADSSAESADASGLSDQDKDRLMSAYEKNKTEYEGTEEDGIFKKVSKAYVRNLEKVLTKKKKIEN